MPQSRHDQLPHGAFVAVELDPFIDILNLAALPLGLGDLAVLPAVCGKSPHTRQHARTTAADGDESDLSLRQLAQAGIGGRARVEQQTGRVAPRLFFPVVGELRDHAVGLVSEEIGGRVTEHPPADRLRHERHHRGQGPVPHRYPVVLQIGLGAAKGDGVEVEVEAQGRVSQRGLGDHGGDQPLGHGPLGLVGIVGRVGDLGQHVEAREQSRALVMTKVADVTDAPFAEELGSQERQQRLQRRDLLRAGQTRVGNSLGQIEVQQQGKEQEETGHLGEELPSFARATTRGRRRCRAPRNRR